MLERDEYPAGVPCWVDTAQPDAEAASVFYADLFGWSFEDRSGPGQRYFIAQLRGGDVAGIGENPPGAGSAAASPVWNTYVAVESVDETAAKVKTAGGQVVMEPFDVPGAGRMAAFSDPSGATFCVWQAGEWSGARLVNEPGTWNFSELNTRDPKGASAFYGDVFGWEVSDFEMDGTGYGLWRMPGYGDFLERSDPDLRQRQDEVGAPEGFEDAVAWLVPMTADQFPDGTPSHWSITFAVDDADAVATRAEELGGKVLAPPADAPWVRMTVVSDPWGAVFTASKFTPPTA
jgi:uncharacterized protein